MEPDGEKYLSLKEASKLAPYSAKYLGLWVSQGKLKAIRIGYSWVTTKKWLDEYIASTAERRQNGKKHTPEHSVTKENSKRSEITEPNLKSSQNPDVLQRPNIEFDIPGKEKRFPKSLSFVSACASIVLLPPHLFPE